MQTLRPLGVLAQTTGWRRWWLPENFSVHGGQLDLLFNTIFVVCAIVMLGVFFFLIKFCIKYRYRPEVKKAHFTHGNKRLELIWTIIPTILLLALSLWAAGAWDAYRYAPKTAVDPERAQILVIAQQFKWNVVYPGPDKKLGRYLIYPRTTDTAWPFGSDLASITGVAGPAYLPPEKAQKFLSDYIQNTNPLGKDFSDPDGADDDWKDAIRTLHVPKGRPIDIHLSSRDVLHDFYLPEYRVKLDAVPGMRGHIYFTATHSSAEIEKQTQRDYTPDELAKVIENETTPQYRFVVAPENAGLFTVTETIPGGMKKARGPGGKVIMVPDPAKPPREVTRPIITNGDSVTKQSLEALRQPIEQKYAIDKLAAAIAAPSAPEQRFVVADSEDEKVKSAVTNGAVVTAAGVEKLKAAGVETVTASRQVAKVTAIKSKVWEIVCEELCGNGHTAMRGTMVVLEPEEYARRFESKRDGTAPPAAAPVAQAAP